mmetsp:Transcript_120063/g.299494  ORF Transcript_120063/g.299494 Transcript_120063/m.299494 type:complete len:599 (-) Transcript_120063:214-2010(-)
MDPGRARVQQPLSSRRVTTAGNEKFLRHGLALLEAVQVRPASESPVHLQCPQLLDVHRVCVLRDHPQQVVIRDALLRSLVGPLPKQVLEPTSGLVRDALAGLAEGGADGAVAVDDGGREEPLQQHDDQDEEAREPDGGRDRRHAVKLLIVEAHEEDQQDATHGIPGRRPTLQLLPEEQEAPDREASEDDDEEQEVVEDEASGAQEGLHEDRHAWLPGEATEEAAHHEGGVAHAAETRPTVQLEKELEPINDHGQLILVDLRFHASLHLLVVRRLLDGELGHDAQVEDFVCELVQPIDKVVEDHDDDAANDYQDDVHPEVRISQVKPHHTTFRLQEGSDRRLIQQHGEGPEPHDVEEDLGPMGEDLPAQWVCRDAGLDVTLALKREIDGELRVDVGLYVQVQPLDGDVLRAQVDPSFPLQPREALAHELVRAVDLQPHLVLVRSAWHRDERQLGQLERLPKRAVRPDDAAWRVAAARVEGLQVVAEALARRHVLPARLRHPHVTEEHLQLVLRLQRGHQCSVEPRDDLPMLRDVSQPHHVRTGTRQRNVTTLDAVADEARALEGRPGHGVLPDDEHVGDPERERQRERAAAPSQAAADS